MQNKFEQDSLQSPANPVIGSVGPITGRHVLAGFICFFGIIITVNFYMAYLASKSWTGLIVKNSYVASQNFNAMAAALEVQQERGWKSRLGFEQGIVTIRFFDGNNAPLAFDMVTALFRHPILETKDQQVELHRKAGARWQGKIALTSGRWQMVLTAKKGEQNYMRSQALIVDADGSVKTIGD